MKDVEGVEEEEGAVDEVVEQVAKDVNKEIAIEGEGGEVTEAHAEEEVTEEEEQLKEERGKDVEEVVVVVEEEEEMW